jgi:hypothetical protein
MKSILNDVAVGGGISCARRSELGQLPAESELVLSG